jgi:DNA-damage-inducible protein J
LILKERSGMANTPTTTMRLDPELKDRAMKVLEPLGLNMTGAVTIFLKAVVRKNGIPFDVALDNESGKVL